MVSIMASLVRDKGPLDCTQEHVRQEEGMLARRRGGPWDMVQEPMWQRMLLADEYVLRALLAAIGILTPRAWQMPWPPPAEPERPEPEEAPPVEPEREELPPEEAPEEAPGEEPEPPEEMPYEQNAAGRSESPQAVGSCV
jgi:hypothetical protein